MYTVEFDSNCHSFLSRLLYYFYTQNLLKEVHTFVAEESLELGEDSYFLLHPKEDLQFQYEEKEILVQYACTRNPRNNHGCVVRFDKISISSEDQAHLMSFLNKIQQSPLPESKKNKLCKYIWETNDENWMFAGTIKARKIDTIYLPKVTEIRNNLSDFLHNKERQELYTRLDIPYRLTFMLYGPPGTGKTSLIRALASEMEYNLAVVKNIQKMDDKSLERMLSQLRSNTFLIFEDVDCLFDQRNTLSNSGISYSGLLNMLDGLGNYEKLVVFITTNHLEQLDHALKRRIDSFIEFTFVQKPEVLKMYKNFFTETDLAEAEKFWGVIRKKQLTVNILEKFFMYCLQHKQTPFECGMAYLDEYTAMVSDFNISQLYS